MRNRADILSRHRHAPVYHSVPPGPHPMLAIRRPKPPPDYTTLQPNRPKSTLEPRELKTCHTPRGETASGLP
ncbi:hypothetical protein BC830DRAFT_1124458 [Chytriomyces sp. MP71]|nr:hypothetical protein BC830DRAFT_1124458 [Chytriomyces sp. MP71]